MRSSKITKPTVGVFYFLSVRMFVWILIGFLARLLNYIGTGSNNTGTV